MIYIYENISFSKKKHTDTSEIITIQMKYKQIGWLITAHSCSPHPDPHLRSGDVCRWLLTRYWLLALSIVHSKHCPMHHHHQPSHRSLRSDNTGHCSQCASVHHGKVGGHCHNVIIILHKHFTNIYQDNVH